MFKKHFRFNKLVAHPAYIFAEKDGYFYFFYVTHQKHWRKIKNIRLHGALQNGDSHTTQYIVPILLKAKPSMFREETVPLKFHRNDGVILRKLYKKYRIKEILK